MNIKFALWFIGALSPLSTLAPAAIITPTYHVTNLGVLPGASTISTFGWSINNYGQVVGESGGKAFLWQPTSPNAPTGTQIDLSAVTNGTFAHAQSINNYGQITGSGVVGTNTRSFVWKPTTPNGISGSFTVLTASNAMAINDYGQVTGDTFLSVGGIGPFLWTPSAPNGTTGVTRGIPAFPGGATIDGWGYGISASGQVIGQFGLYRAYLWNPAAPNDGNTATGGVFTNITLEIVGTGDQAAPLGINSAGQIAGYWFDDTNDEPSPQVGNRAFLWTPATPNGNTGTSIDLGNMPGAGLGDYVTEAFGINALSHVVGRGDTTAGFRAFLWTPAGGMINLSQHVDASGAGWQLTDARGINDAGQIVGYGRYDPDGPGGVLSVQSAFLLTPIPEPHAAGVILLVAAASRAAQRKRSRQCDRAMR